MANGYQVDPLSIMLDAVLDLKEASGRIEQRLDDGKQFHHEVRETLKEYGNKLQVHDRQITMLHKKGRKRSFFVIMEWIGVIKQIWPLLFLITTLAGAIGLHVPAVVQSFIEHSKPE